ncbi:MAG: sigma-70 family RNA polymerase sigma factor [Anaerolinea sp.]|nr:sigma-70 family RNA polymerase sigma factor [Anaerolinea sp.]MCC6974533.1 sigma-70 family RNA polymerase sigma factor [Anaerolineae bacterium]CAG1003037.1 ECF RNA polymerase sigma factor SigW [Anaerolineae bacterium]
MNDAEIMAHIRAGDKTACGVCIERYSPAVYRLALRLTEDEQEAEDVTQETFLNAFKNIDSFEARSGIATWLYRIAFNVALTRRRADHQAVSIDEVADEESPLPLPTQFFDFCCLPESTFQESETRSELERAIRELPETLRSVFILRELEERSTQECAQTLKVTPEVVKQRLHRARLWLRERLSHYFGERVK